jgi:hypothetical protein
MPNIKSLLGAFFAAAKNRAIRGSGFASGPACGVAAPHPSYPLRCPKNDILSFFGPGVFASQNPQEWKQPASMPA